MREAKAYPIKKIGRYDRNARTHSDEQIRQIAGSIKVFGWTSPILLNEEGQILAGHGRLAAAELLGMEAVPVIVLDGMTPEEQRAYVLADNKIAMNAGWNEELLTSELAWLQEQEFDLALTGFSEEELAKLLPDPDSNWDDFAEGEGQGSQEPEEPAKEPPFAGEPSSVLNGRDGWWIARKQWWLDKGLKSEVGRDVKCLASTKTFKGKHDDDGEGVAAKGVSIFDPVMCECAYRWLCPPDGVVLDPFAGGSVRGVVASSLGLQYVGVELRPEQVEANYDQAQELCQDAQVLPEWINGDSRRIDELCANVSADLVFSCPPYADLEVYSDDARDLSTMPYEQFLAAYREIVAKSCDLLKPGRFACFVVGEVRRADKVYRGFVADTIQAFEDAGLKLYQSGVLVTMVGNTSLTISRNFRPFRRLGKTHQNVLIFVKGGAAAAEKVCSGW